MMVIRSVACRHATRSDNSPLPRHPADLLLRTISLRTGCSLQKLSNSESGVLEEWGLGERKPTRLDGRGLWDVDLPTSSPTPLPCPVFLSMFIFPAPAPTLLASFDCSPTPKGGDRGGSRGGGGRGDGEGTLIPTSCLRRSGCSPRVGLSTVTGFVVAGTAAARATPFRGVHSSGADLGLGRAS